MNDDEIMNNVFGDGNNSFDMSQVPSVMLMLGQLAGGPANKFDRDRITGEEVEFHDSPKIILPKGMGFRQAKKILDRLQEQAETLTSFDRSFKYRPDDGAYATLQVIKDRYGMLLGETQQTFFGLRPAETRTINIGFNNTIQVPWGLITIPTLDGLELVLCDRHPDPEFGNVFEIHAQGPRKYQDEMQELFDAIEEYLRTNSIYRGHALVGANRLDFIDLSTFDPNQIVFADKVTEILEGTIWAALRYTPAFREEGLPLKRAALLSGPYGTGKSSAGLITAQIAVENGWTFLSARPGRDSIEDVLKTARLYQPAVVFFEDIDVAASDGDDDPTTRLLDAFDGITAKGGEIVIMMTTNHEERIQKGMMRPGRFDAVVRIEGLDRNGVETLVRTVIPAGKLAEDVDFDEVYKAMDGFLPAFVREAITRASTFAISRLHGARNYVLTTDDLVKAAESLHPQLKALNEATEGERRPTLDTAIGDAVMRAAQHAIHGTQLADSPDARRGVDWYLSVPSLITSNNGNGSHS